MGAFPDWWPANPVGSWWDENQKTRDSIVILLWLLGGLGVLLLAIYIWRRIE